MTDSKTKTPVCPDCGAQNWDTYSGRDAHYYGGFSMSCATCWRYSINLTREQLLQAVLTAEGPVIAALAQ
jgi:hypothetical protein